MQNKTVKEQSKKRPREKEERKGEENETEMQENNGTEPPKKMTKKENEEIRFKITKNGKKR